MEEVEERPQADPIHPPSLGPHHHLPLYNQQDHHCVVMGKMGEEKPAVEQVSHHHPKEARPPSLRHRIAPHNQGGHQTLAQLQRVVVVGEKKKVVEAVETGRDDAVPRRPGERALDSEPEPEVNRA